MFAGATLLIQTGLACLYVGEHVVWCNPDNHVIQGHALWHGLSAGSMACFAKVYHVIPYNNQGKINGGSESSPATAPPRATTATKHQSILQERNPQPT
jgi:hypothetical protein